MIYHFPGIVKSTITRETFLKLAEIPHVVALKDSLCDVTEFRHNVVNLRANGRDFRCFLGSDVLTDVVVLLGGQGTVPSMSNIAASYLVQAYEAAIARDWVTSAEAQLVPLALKEIYNVAGDTWFPHGVIAGPKCALNLLGVPVGAPAAPIPACNAEQTQAVEAILRKGGLLK